MWKRAIDCPHIIWIEPTTPIQPQQTKQTPTQQPVQHSQPVLTSTPTNVRSQSENPFFDLRANKTTQSTTSNTISNTPIQQTPTKTPTTNQFFDLFNTPTQPTSVASPATTYKSPSSTLTPSSGSAVNNSLIDWFSAEPSLPTSQTTTQTTTFQSKSQPSNATNSPFIDWTSSSTAQTLSFDSPKPTESISNSDSFSTAFASLSVSQQQQQSLAKFVFVFFVG